MAQKIDKFTKYRALICAMAVNFMIGSYYMYSNMYIYVSHYLRNQPGNDMDKEGKKAQLIMPIWLMVQSCVSVLSVKIGEKIGFKTLNYIAFVWFTLNNLAMIYVKDYYVYVAVYGVSNGIACGLGYLPGLYTAWTYFPEKKSVATGLILFCAGMSASISSPIVTRIVNPNNVDPSEKEVYERVPYLFQCLTIAYGSITLLACTFQPAPFQSSNAIEKREIRRKMSTAQTPTEKHNLKGKLRGLSLGGAGSMSPGFNQMTEKDVERVTKELFLRDMGTRTGEDAILMNQLDADELEDLVKVHHTEDRRSKLRNSEIAPLDETFKVKDEAEVVRESADQIYQLSKEIQEQFCPSFYYGFFSSTFLMLAIMAFCCAIYNYFLLTAWKALFKDYLHFQDSALANLLIIGACSNSSFRIIVGILLLKFSFKTFYYIAISVIVVSAFSFDMLVIKGGDKVIGLVFLFLAFAGLGTMVTIFPTICVKIFGSEVGPKLYPCIYVCFSTASFAAYLVYRMLDDPVQMFYTFGGFAVLGLFVAMFFDQNPSWQKAIIAHAKDQEQLQLQQQQQEEKQPAKVETN